MKTKVTLLSWTPKPVETIATLWGVSRSTKTIEEVKETIGENPYAENLFEDLLTAELPIVASLHFNFILEGVSISFREQLVRHMIGSRIGEGIGADYVPTLDDSSFWVQSMRALPMKDFAMDGQYHMPKGLEDYTIKSPTLADGYEKADVAYKRAMIRIQDTYNNMIEAGVPYEEARNILPVGIQHRLNWSINGRALLHVIKKRTCWITQLGQWQEVLFQMVSELCDKVHPVFRQIAAPPCVKKKCYGGCPYVAENKAKVEGTDPLPVCPLWVGEELKDAEYERAKRSYDNHPLTPLHEKSYLDIWGKTSAFQWRE